MDVRLDGRTALITGGSKGLGLAMATEFARSGADVVIVARRPDVLAEAKALIGKTAKTRVATVAADVATAAGIKTAYEAAMAAFGKVDIVVNNAGKAETHKFEEITDEIWQSDLNLKLFAAIRMTRLALPQMKTRKWGRVINVLNTGAKTPGAGSAPTTVSRAAGLALTKVLAGEGAPHNVLVNALLVGQIESDQWVRRHKAQGANVGYDEFIKGMGSKLPLGRIGTAQEFANIACLLVSDAGGYINGTAINVDGGASPVV
ncbi:MAG: SDR family oxidoreductase [Alphaproteobacteria bacterium]|nr:SDR family oxidoreductase [Alphaproteobacteria bacterium]